MVKQIHILLAYLREVILAFDFHRLRLDPVSVLPIASVRRYLAQVDLGIEIRREGITMEPTTLEQMGKALNMSPYYLSHVFKEMSGYSPGQYLLRRRVGEAQTLLITTDYPITKIAEMVGYETQSYFNLQFTKNVGMFVMPAIS